MQTTDGKTTTTEISAEREFLQLMIKTCRAIRDPRKKRTRTELLVPAAQWEMKIEKRLKELAA